MNNTLKSTQEYLNKYSQDNRILIASHRGSVIGGIPENTIPAFEIALKNNADVIEVDVARTKDGKLVISHDRILDRFTTGKGLISEHSLSEIRNLYLMSSLGYITDFKMHSLDEFLEHFKDKCIINLDQCGKFIDEAYETVKKYNMLDQVILKTNNSIEKSVNWLNKQDRKPLFMPVINNEIDMKKLFESPKINNMPAVELILQNGDISLLKPSIVNKLHQLNKRIWINSLSINTIIPANRGDNYAILNDENQGWGWLLEQGADIIQTDWVPELHNYLLASGYDR